MNGFVAIYRKIMKHPLLGKNPKARHLFVDLVTMAPWKECTQDWRGKPVQIKRGQLMMSVRELANLTGLTDKAVRIALGQCQNHDLLKLGTQKGKAPTIITICNFDKYQHLSESQGEVHGKDGAHPTAKKMNKEQLEQDSGKPKKKRATRIADDWTLPADWLAETLKKHPEYPESDIRREAIKFHNHFLADGSAKAAKRDWKATWSNWVLNAISYGHLKSRQAQLEMPKTREEIADERYNQRMREKYAGVDVEVPRAAFEQY